MPAGMLLRSPRRATHIADPARELSIDRYEQAEGTAVRVPTLRLEEFIAYGTWFQRHAVPHLDLRQVTSVARSNGAFILTLDDREQFVASRVVVAAGLAPFAARPEPLAGMPRSLVSHSSEHDDLAAFRGKRLVVVGAGQSALESAALLSEQGATVEALARGSTIKWLADDTQAQAVTGWRRIVPRPPPTGVGGSLTGWVAAVPGVFRHVPHRLKPWVSYRCIRPAGSGWLRPRLEDVAITCGRSITQAEARDGRLRLLLDDGSERTVEHVVLGTGYEIDVTRYEFLAPVAGEIETVAGYPCLGPGLESTVPGLHFLGAPAALSFGPIMRFVVGTWYAAPALTLRVVGRRQRPLRVAF
jgi:cation diffusion facilitator CzcD-associated flavoprotein CzcO